MSLLNDLQKIVRSGDIDVIEKAVSVVVDSLSERVEALESAPMPQPSTRFYAANKSDDGDLDTGLSDDADVFARLTKTAHSG